MSWGLFLTPACKSIFPKADVLIPTTGKLLSPVPHILRVSQLRHELKSKTLSAIWGWDRVVFNLDISCQKWHVTGPYILLLSQSGDKPKNHKGGARKAAAGIRDTGSDPRQSQFCQVPLWKWTCLAVCVQSLLLPPGNGSWVSCALHPLPFLWASGFSPWDSLSFLLSFFVPGRLSICGPSRFLFASRKLNVWEKWKGSVLNHVVTLFTSRL